MSEKKKHIKFDVIIGNPPYQEEAHGDQKRFTAPIYNTFMSGSYGVGHAVELITPARFLFNAGSTPKKWNHEMLSDPHLKVLEYFQNSSRVFKNVSISAGVAVTLRNSKRDYGAIHIFSPYSELNTIRQKVMTYKGFQSFSKIVSSRGPYRFTDQLHQEHPNAKKHLSTGHAYDLSSNVFDRLSNIFFDNKPQDNHQYIQIYGRQNNERCFKYIRADYVEQYKSLNSYKVFLSQAGGAGAFGALSQPIIGKPSMGHTETFLSIGNYNNPLEAKNTIKYIKTKFCRVLLGVKKVTQSNVANKWECVPLQDFTSSSDIDWSKSVHEIDLQLYKKYNLSQNEINFIEKHVKTMD